MRLCVCVCACVCVCVRKSIIDGRDLLFNTGMSVGLRLLWPLCCQS